MPLFFKRKTDESKGSGLNVLLSMGRDKERSPKGLSETEKGTGQRGRGGGWAGTGAGDGKESSLRNGHREDGKLGAVARGPQGYNSTARNMSSIAFTASFASPAHHSHRNVRPSHQMLIAESMFDPNEHLSTTSRLSKPLIEALGDSNLLSYFVQFMEVQDQLAKNMIRLWIQIECFKSSVDGPPRGQNNVSDEASDLRMRVQLNDVSQDATRIFNKYISEKGSHRVEVETSFKSNLEKRLFCEKAITRDLFDEVQSHISSIMEPFYADFLRSSFFSKYQIDVLTKGGVSLADILYNDSTLFHFMEFMEQEEMRTYVDFLLMAENFRRFGSHREDALVLFNRFFRPESPNYLEFSDNIKCQIEDQVKEGTSDCFDLPMSVLLQYFDKTYFKQFLESQTYITFLTEIINSLQNAAETRRRQRRGSGSSDCSATDFRSFEGTSGGPVRGSMASSSSSSRQFCPEDLWRRDLAGKLQIAYVDQYGKVTSDLEPEPDKPVGLTSMTITKAMKMINLNPSDEKSKEEMAWQVAEMIVNDVCRVTGAQECEPMFFAPQ